MLIKNINHRIIIPLSFFFLLFLLFNYFISFSQSQICLPLNGYLVWPGSWEEGWVPMASSSQYFLTRSPIKVYNGNVGIGTLPLAYKLQVNGDISGTRLCIGSDCRNSWPSGGGNISGSGNQGQVTFWTSSTTISGSNNLFWDNTNNRLGIGTTTPQSTLHVVTLNTTTSPFQVKGLVGFDPNLMPGWNYRRPITIDNTSNSNNLTDYQVLVTLNTQSLISSGKMRNDCGDIRFTDSNGTTLLNYWLESGCNTTLTKIWVKVPLIPANSTKTIYIYYGNPSATSLSNPDNTFIFFDDFETNRA